MDQKKPLDAHTAKFKAAGLNPQTIQNHQRRLMQALHQGRKPVFAIIDTCRPSNGGILDLAQQARLKAPSPPSGYAAFIPAAGAASRYFEDLAPLKAALTSRSDEELWSAANQHGQDACQVPLPDAVAELLKLAVARKPIPATLKEQSQDVLRLPKALLPCVLEGQTFLDVKFREHTAIRGLGAQVYVAAPGREREFENAAKESSASDLDFAVYTQGPELSTARFLSGGEPVFEKNGDVSVVPAGHGTLTALFPLIKRRLASQKVHSLFIRNIDNVMGTAPEALAACEQFLAFHQTLLNALQAVRQNLDSGNLKHAAAAAAPFISLMPQSKGSAAAAEFLESASSDDERSLWGVQLDLFGLDPELIAKGWPRADSASLLKTLYHRPFNILGQVPNTQHDVGGTPVWAKTAQGPMKICLELPHASASDREQFLTNPAKATHFNPVFVAAELVDDARVYDDPNDAFWVLSQKPYEGQTVYYHETILYELLGNNYLANALFVEVPRLVFNPHKTYLDARGRHLQDWIAPTSS